MIELFKELQNQIQETNKYLDQIIQEGIIPEGITSNQEPEFKEGDWVVLERLDWLIKIVEINNDDLVEGFYFDERAEFIESGAICHFHELGRKATPEEIKKALVKEAKRRYEGKVVDDLCDYDKSRIDLATATYYPKDDDLYFKGIDSGYGICVYKKGKWAEVVPEKDERIFTLLAHWSGDGWDFTVSDEAGNTSINISWDQLGLHDRDYTSQELEAMGFTTV